MLKQDSDDGHEPAKKAQMQKLNWSEIKSLTSLLLCFLFINLSVATSRSSIGATILVVSGHFAQQALVVQVSLFLLLGLSLVFLFLSRVERCPLLACLRQEV